MKQKYAIFSYYLLILFITIVTVFDLFANPGRSANMDGLTHTTTIGMFYNILSNGEFPISWVDGFANYGMPLPLIAHQVPNYLGALINFITHDPAMSFNIVCFLGLLASNILFFVFLRLYFNPMISFLGVFIFNFAPYRILNLYIRGAIPEAFSNIFLPLILISMYFLIKKKNIYGFYFLIISILMLALAHPMTLVTFSFVYLPYLFYLIVFDEKGFNPAALIRKDTIKIFVLGLCSVVIGIGMAGYYILPLNLELKYFYYGHMENHLTEGQYLTWQHYFDPEWYYFTEREIFPRGHVISAGLVETLGVIAGIIYLFYKWVIKKERVFSIIEYAVGTSIFIIFFTTSLSDIFYRHISILSNIQFPWRMLSGYMFLPPIVFAYLLSKLNRVPLMIGFIALVCFIRFPQLYGKNYTQYPVSFYYFTEYNLHSTLMNTIWTGRTEDYPVKSQKFEIIEGEGKLEKAIIKSSSRMYTVDAISPLRVVDYTFYFPGWKVYVDGKEQQVEYQDPSYRGVITYTVPQGKHMIQLVYEDTKVRLLGKIISIFFVGVFILTYTLRKRISGLVYSK